MYLGIRTDSPVTGISLFDLEGNGVAADQWESGRQLSSQLLNHIQTLLDRQERSWDGLKGIIVFRGPGSFTGLRIGITVANAIAYAQGIPIVGAAGDNWTREGAKRLSAGATDTQVAPEYGGEANITRPGPA